MAVRPTDPLPDRPAMVHSLLRPSHLATTAGLLGALLLTAIPARTHAQAPVFELDTLLVSGASRLPGGAVGRSVTILDRDALRALPVASATEALRYLVGVDLQSRSPAQADLSLRGSGFEEVLVLVDGVRMSDPQTGHFDLDLTVPLDRVERIELLVGPASAQFGGDAVGGVVNVVTRSGDRGADLRAEGGTFGRSLFSGTVHGTLGGWASGVGAEQTRSDGHRPGTDYEISTVDGRVVRAIGAGEIQGSVGHARRDFGAGGFYGPFPDAFERTRTTTAHLSWTRPLEGVALTPRAIFRRHTDEFILRRADPSFYRNFHTSDQWGGDLTARLSLRRSVALAFGGEWVRETLESNNLGVREEDRSAAFAEVTTPVGPGHASLGLRVDGREEFDTFVSPSASLSLPLGAHLKVRAAAGRAFRTPTWTERYYQDPANIASPDLDSERSWSAELGADATLSGGGMLRATVFRRKSEDLIDWAKPADQLTEPWRTRNVAEATFDGLELHGAQPLGGQVDLIVRGEWLTLDASDEPGTVSKVALRPIIRTVAAGLRARGPSETRLSLDLRGVTRQGEEGVLLLDAQASVPLGIAELFISGTNLGEASYLDIAGQPAEGRRLTVGLRASLGGG